MKNKNWLMIAFFLLLTACDIQSSLADDNAIPGEILIDFEESCNSEKIEFVFEKYELKMKKVISPSLNIVLFGFNPEKIDCHKLIKKIKRHEGVEEAQSNKKITKRA